MTGWNMPPGVGEGDIPGNRPEDEDEDRFWDRLEAEMEKTEPGSFVKLDDLPKHLFDVAVRMIQTTRDLAYADGLADAKSEAWYERMEREQADALEQEREEK